jgi:hypothetical protein
MKGEFKFPPEEKRYESKPGIDLIPNCIMFKYKLYDIIKVHQGYHIKKYWIIVNNKSDKIIEGLWIGGCCHPNAYGGEDKELFLNDPPLRSKFCLSETVKGCKIISNSLLTKYSKKEIPRPNYPIQSDKLIRFMLTSWYLDNPHHFPLNKHIKTKPPLPRELM